MDIAKRSIDEAEIKLQRFYWTSITNSTQKKLIQCELAFRLDFEHSKFLSSVSDEYRDDPERFVEEEAKLLESIKTQYDEIETARKVYQQLSTFLFNYDISVFKGCLFKIIYWSCNDF